MARTGDPFSDADRKLLRYLAGRAALALEVLDSPEIAREVDTDGPTLLSNRRRFYEAVELEIELWRRTGRRGTGPVRH